LPALAQALGDANASGGEAEFCALLRALHEDAGAAL
jgi:hypothetical protein